MKKILLLLLLLPFILQSQNQDHWLTQFANASFVDGKIEYSYCRSELLVVHNIIPRYYSESLMKLKMDYMCQPPSPEAVAIQQQKIREYLKEEDAIKLNLADQKEYLRLSAMVLVWDLKLDASVMKSIGNLKGHDNRQVQKQAELVWKLEEVYAGLR